MKTNIESIRHELYSIVEKRLDNPFNNAKDLARFIFIKDLLNDGNYEELEFIIDVICKINEYRNVGYKIIAEEIPLYISKNDFFIDNSYEEPLYIATFNGRKFSMGVNYYNEFDANEKIYVDVDYDIYKYKE